MVQAPRELFERGCISSGTNLDSPEAPLNKILKKLDKEVKLIGLATAGLLLILGIYSVATHQFDLPTLLLGIGAGTSGGMALAQLRTRHHLLNINKKDQEEPEIKWTWQDATDDMKMMLGKVRSLFHKIRGTE